MVATAENAFVCYQIKDLVLDAGSRRVTRGDEVLAMGPLTFDLILALAECSPHMATYEQLAERVWNGREVSPETIAQRAKMLRAALSDDAKSPKYFELIRGQGYRLVADAKPITDRAGKPAPRRWAGVAATVVVAAAMLIAVSSMLRNDDLPTSVAVLPFADLSEERDQQYFADGITEELINALAELDGLEVASRSESFFYRGPTDDLQKLGEKLGVTAIVEGSVRKSENELRITVQLIEIASGYHLWSKTFDRELREIFAIQEDIASSVAGALGVKLGVGGVNEFRGAGTQNFAAYEAYLQRDYAKAIQLDPNYAGAWARYGLRTVATMWHHLPEEAPEIIERAYQYVAKAIELDPQSARAHIDFAALIYATMDWERAEQAFATAISLDRSENALMNFANMLMRAGRSSSALALHEERDAMLRRPEAAWSKMRANAYIASGRFDVVQSKVLQMPDDKRRDVSLMIALNENSDGAVRAALQAMPQSSVRYREFYAPLLQVLDSSADSLSLMKELADDPNRAWPSKYHDIALVAAYLGQTEFAIDVLSRDLRYTTIRFGVLWYPVMAEVRKLPEFKKFVTDVTWLPTGASTDGVISAIRVAPRILSANDWFFRSESPCVRRVGRVSPAANNLLRGYN